MARYAISPEGADGLRTLSETLKQSLSAAVDANKGLQNTIAGIMESLGVYGLEIWGITLKVKDTLDSEMEEIDTLVENLRNKADEIEEMLGLSSALGGGQNTSLGAESGSYRPDLATSSTSYSGIRNSLEARNVEYRAIKLFAGDRSLESIVARLGGGDKTQGSCSSLAFAYAESVAGYDVLDFRDGASREFFSSNSSISMIAGLPGVESKVITGQDDIACANALLAEMEPGKEYYFATGQHAAVVRLNNGHYEYLELQSASDNGWHVLHDGRLYDRFGCDVNTVDYPNFLIDIESLGRSDEFLDILGYINTDEDSQVKGASDHVR